MPRNEAVLASARCGMAVVTAEGEWLSANPALCRMLGCEADALSGQAAHHRLFPEEAGRIDALLRARAAGAAVPGAVALGYRTPSGEALRFDIDATGLPAPDGQAPLLLLQLQDVTAAHRSAAALQALRQQQDWLAYGMSHDLRAALRSIDGFATLLEAQVPEAGREHLSRIRAASGQAGALLQALVALMRAGSADYAAEPVDMSLLAAWALAELQEAEPSRHARLEVQPGLVVRGDERRLKGMLDQLLHNAWKFSADRSGAEIAVEGRATDRGMLELCVRDNGRGFDMRHADKLFVPFRRLHGPDEGAGPGLGLAIVQVVVQRHGGRAWARSQPGAGSRFFVELPAVEAGNGR